MELGFLLLLLKIILFQLNAKNYELPLFPHYPPPVYARREKLFISTLNLTEDTAVYNNSLIPKHVWISFRYVPSRDQMADHLKKFIERAVSDGWKINLMGKDDQAEFMETFFFNTSTLWAFKLIHEDAGVFASDIWRYCALYRFGGFYMDDDSYLEAHLDSIIMPGDSMILAHEKNVYKDDCYVPTYNLSTSHLEKARPNINFGSYFGKRVLVNWAMFTSPLHFILAQLLSNVVDMIKHEYLRDSVIKVYRYDPRWKLCMCNTGPQALTATVRSLMSEHELQYGNTKNFSLRVVRKDFEEFGGVYKVGDYDRQVHESKLNKKSNNTTANIVSGYYMHTMNKKKTPCLSAYLPVDASVLDGKAITTDNRVMYLVRNGSKCVFPDYDTFLAMKFDVHYVTRLEAAEFDSIPTGPQLQPLDFPG